MRPLAGALAVLLTLCAGSASAARPAAPVAAGPAITVQARPVALNPADPRQDRVGNFAYAGGLVLTSRDTARLHGLSDLKVWPDGRLLSVSDEGDLLEGRLVLDAAGRPNGIAAARLSPLAGEDGRPLPALGKNEADSEGIAELAGGDRLVSLERDDRILLYPHDGGAPRRAPAPDEKFPFNLGMEALAADPEAGDDAYVVGGEASGQTWVCHLASGCTASARVAKPAEAGLSAVATLPGGRRAYLLRSFSVLAGMRTTLRVVDATGATLDEMRLASPLTVDNFEGLAGLPRADGSVRCSLISDDNLSNAERTLFLAFDWKPQKRR
ncbi:MAG: hypothetical protein JWQ97_3665 [Phenylobacterium sp.]|nr:hypothetical protein [Phenylobacterium sp.]